MRPDERLEYSAIIDRPVPKLPDGARMVVWTIVNVEVWDSTKPQPRTVITPPAGGSPIPDVPNWAWHEYGNRIGFWRMKEILDAFEVPTTLALNGLVCKAYPRIAEEALKAGWEFMGHGYSQLSMQKVEDERLDIQKTRDTIEEFTGKRPRGWLGPALTDGEAPHRSHIEAVVDNGRHRLSGDGVGQQARRTGGPGLARPVPGSLDVAF